MFTGTRLFSQASENIALKVYLPWKFSLTLEKGDPSGRVEGCKWRRRNRSYTYVYIAETCVLHLVIASSSVTHPRKLCKITWNHAEKLVTIALNIFYSYFMWNFCLPQIIKHGSMLNHAWCFAWSSMRVSSYSWAVPYYVLSVFLLCLHCAPKLAKIMLKHFNQWMLYIML